MSPRVAPSIAGLGGGLTLAAMLHEGSPGDLSWWGAFAGFGTWGLLPFLVIFVLARRLAASPAAQSLLAGAAAVVTFSAACLLFDALFGKKSSTYGLVFLFVPPLQLLVVVPLALAGYWAARKGELP